MVVVKDAKGKDKEDPVEGVGHVIAKECKEMDLVKDTYTTHIHMDRAVNQISPTLQRISENLSLLFCNSLFTVLIGRIVAGVSQHRDNLHLGYCINILNKFLIIYICIE